MGVCGLNHWWPPPPPPGSLILAMYGLMDSHVWALWQGGIHQPEVLLAPEKEQLKLSNKLDSFATQMRIKQILGKSTMLVSWKPQHVSTLSETAGRKIWLNVYTTDLQLNELHTHTPYTHTQNLLGFFSEKSVLFFRIPFCCFDQQDKKTMLMNKAGKESTFKSFFFFFFLYFFPFFFCVLKLSIINFHEKSFVGNAW